MIIYFSVLVKLRTLDKLADTVSPTTATSSVGILYQTHKKSDSKGSSKGRTYSRWRHQKQRSAETAMESLLCNLNSFNNDSRKHIMETCGVYWSHYVENYHLIEHTQTAG